MEAFIGGFSHPCSYWHSHEPISGGTIYDWGSHYFDWLLQLFPSQVTTVSAVAQKRVWHDVSNADQVRVDLTFAGGEQATFLQSDVAAALKPKWYLVGTEYPASAEEWRSRATQHGGSWWEDWAVWSAENSGPPCRSWKGPRPRRSRLAPIRWWQLGWTGVFHGCDPGVPDATVSTWTGPRAEASGTTRKDTA